MERHDHDSAGDSSLRYCSIVPLVGGFTLGNYLATGKKPEALISYGAFAANEESLRSYWPDVPHYNLDEEEVPSMLHGVDFVSSTCPCAGLSMLNFSSGSSSNSRGSDAAQNEWMYKSSEYVLERIQPKVLFGENAPGLFSEMGKGVAARLFEIGQKHGYSMSLVKTSTAKHGIPQNRVRTFYFFWKSEYAPILSNYNRATKNLVDYLAEVPTDATHQQSIHDWKLTDMSTVKYLLEKKRLKWADVMKEEGSGTLFQYIVQKGWLDDCIAYSEETMPDSKDTRMLHHIKKKLGQGKGFWDASPRLSQVAFNAVISKNMACGAHPVEERFMNVREYMHLMGLPHDYQLVTGTWNHIAQNVPTVTARDWTYEVMKFLRGELASSGQKFYKQNNMAYKEEVEAIEKSLALF